MKNKKGAQIRLKSEELKTSVKENYEILVKAPILKGRLSYFEGKLPILKVYLRYFV